TSIARGSPLSVRNEVPINGGEKPVVSVGGGCKNVEENKAPISWIGMACNTNQDPHIKTGVFTHGTGKDGSVKDSLSPLKLNTGNCRLQETKSGSGDGGRGTGVSQNQDNLNSNNRSGSYASAVSKQKEN
ncbi:hypothetical protein KI387_010243, partial [Taxus chinensis]